MNSKLESAYNVAIKYGFCGDCNKTYGKCNGYDCYENAVKPIRDLIEKAEKYHWHDLRKSPNDLPPNGFYDTWSYWHEKYQNVRAFYNADKRKWIFHPDNNTGKDWVEGLSIIAWKEVETFDEGEEE